ncbi:hypothetical protein [Mesorhizobium sp. M4A.F.Ca.ET.022.05.2.1]|uniref:hypothetical protein n=1 Tax=Mesorhizobium sp. M4A.F.Ca.ET.022.05.2.1 TaxID=2496653 RepID=UPI0016746C6C|nr:hypothetical protein [Mesorhizobium sp. M4A.F.Ca.ET.022.05.2.1]
MAGGELDADQAMATFARIDVSDLPGVERPVADCPAPAVRIVVAFASGTRFRIDCSRRRISDDLPLVGGTNVAERSRTGARL